MSEGPDAPAEASGAAARPRGRISWWSAPFRSLYLVVALTVALPIAAQSLMMYRLEPDNVDPAAQSLARSLLCQQIQDMRSGVVAQLNSKEFDPKPIDQLLGTGSGTLTSRVRWGLSVGEFKFDSLNAPRNSAMHKLLKEIPQKPDGTESITDYTAIGDKHYIACYGVYDLTGKRFGGDQKAIYVVAWPDYEYTNIRQDLGKALRMSSVNRNWLRTVVIPVTIIIGLTIVVMQSVIIFLSIKGFKGNINAVLRGRADRLSSHRYPPEVHPVIRLFNDVIERNEAAVTFTRTLITKMAHDFNNILQSLVSAINAETIDRDLARRQISRMISLIERYRQFSMLSQGDSRAGWRAERFDLIDFIKDLLEIQRMDLTSKGNHYRLWVNGTQEDIDAEPDGDPVTVMVLGQKGDLEIMLANLLSNARKYGGSSNREKYGDGRIDVRVTEEGQDVLIDVDDNGPGIKPEDRQRVFDPGTMLNPDQKLPGTGFGLDIVAMVARHNLGTVTVDDSPLGGARFRLTLPIRLTEKELAEF